MQRSSLFFFLAVGAVAQVLSPPEILDPEVRELQTKHMSDLKAVAVAISSKQFPYHFYFSRTLDVSEQQEKLTDQRSIQFARFEGQVVLQITGNYFASYSADLMKREDRARSTVDEVMIPILKAAADGVGQEQSIQRFALEVSHHIRKKALGVTAERAENVVLTLPRDAAIRLASAGTPAEANLIMHEASVFVDGQPTALWAPQPVVQTHADPAPRGPAPAETLRAAALPPPVASQSAAASPAADTSPAALGALQTRYQEVLNRLTRDLDGTAHFVGYAPPAFISFHNGIYLQLSLTTPVPALVANSRYVAGAVGFDEHISRLIRPVMAYFPVDPGFDGIDFATTVRTIGGAPDSGSALAVEYIFGFPALRSYGSYDSTGQQLINSGFVLINGERVGLDLQSAESTIPR